MSLANVIQYMKIFVRRCLNIERRVTGDRRIIKCFRYADHMIFIVAKNETSLNKVKTKAVRNME